MQCLSTVHGRYVDVKIETFFALALQERSQPLDVVSPQWCLDRAVVVGRRRRRRLGTDGTIAQGDADAIPFLSRTGRRHKPQLAAEKGSVLQAEVRLDERQAAVAESYEDSSQFAVLGLHHPRTHLRRKYLAAHRRPDVTGHDG